ncbi:MAG: hypothetical protein J7M25_11950 [Deltaproteobacteria bacterium]|nr:hypothetical protein [Deltaproteobacteria bacterium]
MNGAASMKVGRILGGLVLATGVFLLGSSRATAQTRLVRPTPYSQAELNEIAKLPGIVQVYGWGVQVFQSLTEHIIERTYLNEKAKIKNAYLGDIEKSRRNTEARRLEAVKEFEAWIKRHPSDKKWTPDVLFRLAELYYEKATVDFQYAQVQYQETVTRIRRQARKLGRELPEPPEPEIDYTVPISYYKRIIREFPHYENIDVAYYLLGYCLREMAKQAEEMVSDEEIENETPGAPSKARVLAAKARQAFLALVCANRYKPLDSPTEPSMPPELESALNEDEQTGEQKLDLGRFDPYKGCRPVVSLSKFTGMALKKRQALLSQAWFIVGEQHFDAEPIVTLNQQEKDQLKAEFYKHRSKEQYINDYQRVLAEKKERNIKVHNYYAISAYTRVIQNFKKAEEYPDALYKRAWTYFRVNMYEKALDEFDRLLLESKDEALRDNAVRYVALCAYYQRDQDDKFAYLLNHYKAKGGLHDPKGPKGKYAYIKRAFQELAKIFYEDAAPPPDTPGPQNYRATDLLAAFKVYQWMMGQAGFGADRPGETDLDWKYYKGRAEVQKAIIDIVYLLTINNEVQKEWPRRKYFEVKRQAFNRFSTYRSSPHKDFAREYEKMWGDDGKVKEALSSLRQSSLSEVANEYYILGRRAWDAKQVQVNALLKEIVGLVSHLSDLQGSGNQEELAKTQETLAQKRQELVTAAKSYQRYFSQAVRSYDVVITDAQFKDTMEAYKALYFKADCLFYMHDYLKAAEAYKAAADSKISNRYRPQALQGRVDSYQLYNDLNVVMPPAPDPVRDKDLVPKKIPGSVLAWHKAMADLLATEKNKVHEAAYSFLVAYTYYRYAHADVAYKLLWGFLQKHCNTRDAFYATKALMAMALIKNAKEGNSLTSLKGLDVERQKLAKAQCGIRVTFPPKTPKKAMEDYAAKVKDFYKKMLGLAADIRMNRADALYKEAVSAKGSAKEAKYLAAARELESIARRYPNSPKAALSLYYAADGYERTKRYRKAKALYEEIVKKPAFRKQIEHVKEEVCSGGGHKHCRTVTRNKLDNVLNFLARAAWRAMEFDQAMRYYGQLAKGKIKVDDAVIRVNSYYWYARLLRIYDKPRPAVAYFMKYYDEIGKVIASLRRKSAKATDPLDKKDYDAQLTEALQFQMEVFYEIGTIYRRLNDIRGMERYYGQYIQHVSSMLGSKPTSTPKYYASHASDRAAAMKMMEALHQLDVAYRGRRRMSKARQYERKIVETFDRYHMPKGENVAADYAAEVAFQDVERDYRRFMAQKLKIRGLSLHVKLRKGIKTRELLDGMCELMGWGVNRRTHKPCKGKAMPMLRSVVNPYLDQVNKLSKRFYSDIGLKYLSPKWVLAVRAKMGQMFAKAAADLDRLPVPPEVKKFWVVFWAFVQKYKVYPKYKALFQKLLGVYEIDVDDEDTDQDALLDAYKEKAFVAIRKNAKTLRDEAIRNYIEGLKLARTMGISSKWTREMRKGLNTIDPDRFPFVHDAKVASTR